MSKVDWSKAPDGAEFYAAEKFRAEKIGANPIFWNSKIDDWDSGLYDMDECMESEDFERNPNQRSQWPSESRIDIIGTNGNTAEHYMEETLHQTAKVHYETQSELAARLKAERKAETKPQNKYDREIVGKYGSGKCIIDVYRVLVAFGDIPPEIQHAIKKLLAGGKRGHKNEGLDYLEAIQSIEAYLNRLDDSSDQSKTV